MGSPTQLPVFNDALLRPLHDLRISVTDRCNFRCRYCMPRERFGANFSFLPRREVLSYEEIARMARIFALRGVRKFRITGGEPLLQPAAAQAVARALGRLGPAIHLETHGLAAEALTGVIEDLDVVSMDWKLASDVRRASDSPRGAAPDFHDAHQAFLEVARRATRTVVKLVVTPRSQDEEIDEAIARIAQVHAGATLVLQPVTPCDGAKRRPTAQRMLVLSERASRQLADVRVIPQTHPIYGVR